MLIAQSYGAKIKSKGDASYKFGEKILLTATDLTSPDVQLLWDISGTGEIDTDESVITMADPASTKEKPLPDKVVQGGKCAVWAKPGKYTVTLTAIDFTTKKIQRTKTTFTVVGVEPPKPPTPVDDKVIVPVLVNMSYGQAKTTLASMGLVVAPTNAGEAVLVTAQSPVAMSKVDKGTVVTLTLADTPPPNPAPINDTGFRVLIVEETVDRSKLPPAQRLILTSGTVRDYLRSKCAPDSTANQDGRAYRIWDKDSDVSNELKSWQDAFKRAKADKNFKTPWILVSNGKTGYEGPLPENVDKMIELLKKYAEGNNKQKGDK